jgi:hypothetical protein
MKQKVFLTHCQSLLHLLSAPQNVHKRLLLGSTVSKPATAAVATALISERSLNALLLE